MNIKQYKDRVANLGCIICGDPAHLHHPRTGVGTGQRNSDWLVIPLCPGHHTEGTTFMSPSVHGAPQFFRGRYGEEMALLAQVTERIMGGVRNV